MSAADPLAVTRVTLVRHGRTAWNAALRIQGHSDVELDAVGQWQAQQLVRALGQEQQPIEAIYASDLQRAMDTARPLAGRLGLAVSADARLRERHFGCLEGLTIEAIDSTRPDDARRWRSLELDYAPTGGESLRDLHARAVSVCTQLAQRHPGQHILVVSHGGLLDCMHRHGRGLAADAPRTWHTGNAGVHRLLHASQGWRVIGWNDEQHLQQDVQGLGASFDG
jgi:2,3-bisphosphoglycerate-dependent phosphoglycerate mutase